MRQAWARHVRQDDFMGAKERGGRIAIQVIPDVKKDALRDVVLENVEPGSVVSTDELMSYGLLEGDGFKHGAVDRESATAAIIAAASDYHAFLQGEQPASSPLEDIRHKDQEDEPECSAENPPPLEQVA